ncbi:MAG: GAF domain-containing protein [Chloroflexi bacterium]|nr:GAF domain-containing protein [Chloroflexota bacterium]
MNIIPRQDGTDTRASLELLYQVSREIATAFDLSTLLQRVLFLSMRSIGAVSGTIIVVDDDGKPVASTIIYGADVLDVTTEQLRATLDNGLAGWVVRNRQSVLIPDTSQDPRWLRRPDDAEDATGPKSAVSAPFLARERLAGVISLVHPDPHFFTLDHLSLVQAIADQSAVAVFNARLHADSLRQARVMTALAESAAAITGSLQLSEVLQRILEQISHALRVEVVSLALIDPRKKILEYRASTYKQEPGVVGMTLELGQGIAGWVAQEQRGVVVPDAYADPRFYPGLDQRTGFETKAIACAPIRSQGEVIGILEAINPLDGVFAPDALLVPTGIGSLAGTAIRHAQLFEDLQTAHKRYRDLFEDSINSILITDREGHIIEANRQTTVLSKYDKEVLLDLSIDLIHDRDQATLGPKFEHVFEGGTFSYESVLNTANGAEIPIIVHAHSVNIEGNTHIQWAFQDITERRELDRLQEDLLSMIYHDLRSPLANVVTSLDVLKTMLTLEDEPAIQSLLDIAVRSTERIQRLTHALLDINRLEAGQPVVNTHPVAAQTLIQDALEAIMPIANNKKQQVSANIPADIPPVMVNGDMIRRVLINLLENATKFTPPEGTIRVGAHWEKQWVCLWVEDTGPGVPQEKRQSIFEKYTRLQGTSNVTGYGLGLAYCRLAVEGHGGRIWVEDAPGAGSRFAFVIPVANEE